MDYNKTINLPKTKFPMKANLPNREPKILDEWKKKNIYYKVLKKRKGGKKYILHDGPPYANGRIHIGHALNKILKDIIVKYKSMRGYYSPYIPGWDCHGLPIEHQVVKNLKVSERTPAKVRKLCREFASKYIDIQRDEFIRLGVFGDWDKPYLTMDKEYEAKILEVFGMLYERGYIYQGLRPIHWCPSCKTALAEAEVEYKEHTSPSIYVSFKVVEGLDIAKENDVYVLIWTTTPWTLPANLAIAINEKIRYGIYETEKGKFILANELRDEVFSKFGISWRHFRDISSDELLGLKCKHPFLDRVVPIIAGEHVDVSVGTGCVHTAPGHGLEDFVVGEKYNLDVLSPVDEAGRFTDEYPDMKGEFVFSANEKIISSLREKGNLLYEEEIVHSYPHCWRCKSPLIFRATRQWFLSVEHNSLRKRLLSAIENVSWIPKWGYDRIKGMIENRPDWCLSRQRFWGVPIPYFVCKSCGATIITPDIIKNVINIVRDKGISAWFELSSNELMGKTQECPVCGGKEFEKGNDILDVWFDSGVSHYVVCKGNEELAWPVDLYLEGSDQHRGWFQTSLIPSVALFDKPPYKAVLTHGFLLDEKGEAMSKSKGNVISPQDIMKKYGADIIRLWVSSENYQEDLRIGYNLLEQLSDAYRKIRNTFRFMLGNLYDFSPNDLLSADELHPFDRWILIKLNELIDTVTSNYENLQFHKVYREIYNFSVVYLSNLYFAINKDILYTYYKKDKRRRSVQTSLYILLNTLNRLLFPVLSFTMEEVYSYIRERWGGEESVALCDFPTTYKEYESKEIKDDIDKLIEIRYMVNKLLEEKRKEKIIRDSLEAAIYIYPTSNEYKELLSKYAEFLPQFFIVSNVYLLEDSDIKDIDMDYKSDEISLGVDKAKGKKCARCWIYHEKVGEDEEYKDLCPKCISAIKLQLQDNNG